MNFQSTFEYWLNNKYYDEETRLELDSIKDNPKEIEDRFYKRLEFGTGGLRGIIGAGTNRINIYTIREASQGLANYIISQGNQQKGAVISYDSRYKSDQFAKEAARVFAGNGIPVYIFDELRPVPELSFTVRLLKAAAGVMITASHNPKIYNGYKVYGEDGGQMPLEWTNAVLEYINKITSPDMIKLANEETSTNLIKWIGKEIDDKYIDRLKTISMGKPEGESNNINIVYTPLHGSGNKLVRRLLKEVGFESVFVVPEQELPDPQFSTVRVPNPEEKDSFDIAIKLAKKEDADLIIATDPDCDRIGIVVRNLENDYVALTGNQVGCLLLEYILSQMQQKQTLPQNGFVVKTIVTSELARDIANNYKVEVIEVLTGFKFIGEKIKELDEYGDKKYIFGFEESYGYLAGTFARDKDAVVSAMLIAQMAEFYKEQGLSLYEGLMNLYKKYRYGSENVMSFTLTGKDGMQKIKNCMSIFRNSRHNEIGSLKVKAVRDYLHKTRIDTQGGGATSLTLPISDALYYELEDGNWFCIRPSGTEPKLKVYYGIYHKDRQRMLDIIKIVEKDISNLIQPLLK